VKKEINISDKLLEEIIRGCKKSFKQDCCFCHYFIECEEIQKYLGLIK